MTFNWAHTHLLLNHFPIVGAIFGLSLLVYAMVKDSKELNLATYWLFIIIALLTIPTYFAGKQAAGIVLDLPNVSEAFVHKHRNIAEWAFIALEITGAFALMGLLISKSPRKTPNWLTATFVIFVIISTGLVSWAGLQGGIIRHTEVRGDLPFLMPDDVELNNNQGSQTEKGGEESEESGHSH
ncbi:hypothetical protein [Calothrix sp. CCY 0018]|uniref:hypothetical protein n=1 Tax=Calothrix sp. CCY 0018 TaxID=3103864 RepID=UPI0039C68BB5